MDNQIQHPVQLGRQPTGHVNGLFNSLLGQWTLFICFRIHASLAMTHDVDFHYNLAQGACLNSGGILPRHAGGNNCATSQKRVCLVR